MGLQVALNHRTQYRYDKAVSLGPQIIQLRPAPHCRTPILSYSLKVTPAEHLLHWQLDPHHNHLARILFSNKTNEFVVEVDLVAEFSSFNPFAFLLEPGVGNYPFKYELALAKDLEPYRTVDPAGPSLRTFLETLSDEKRATIGPMTVTAATGCTVKRSVPVGFSRNSLTASIARSTLLRTGVR